MDEFSIPLERKVGKFAVDGIASTGVGMRLQVDGVEYIIIAPSLLYLAEIKRKLYPDEDLVQDRTGRLFVCGESAVKESK